MGKAFPIRTPLGVLKWRFTSSDESDIPLNVTCWPTPGSDMVTVNLEYELMQTNLQLQDVEIYVPIPQGHQPVVEQADGAYDFDSARGQLIWRLAVVDADNAGGSLEFTLPWTTLLWSILLLAMATTKFNSSRVPHLTTSCLPL